MRGGLEMFSNEYPRCGARESIIELRGERYCRTISPAR